MAQGPDAGQHIRRRKIPVPRRSVVRPIPNRDATPIQGPNRVPSQPASPDPIRHANPRASRHASPRANHRAMRERTSA